LPRYNFNDNNNSLEDSLQADTTKEEKNRGMPKIKENGSSRLPFERSREIRRFLKKDRGEGEEGGKAAAEFKEPRERSKQNIPTLAPVKARPPAQPCAHIKANTSDAAGGTSTKSSTK